MPFTSLLQIEWLANPQGRPAAVRLARPDTADIAGWTGLAATPELAELARRQALWLDDVALATLGASAGDGEAAAQALRGAGVQALAPSALAEIDSNWPAHPPTQALVAGAWYLQPPAKVSAAQAASRARALKLMQLVNADADTREIETELRLDPALSYHLLRMVNSVALRGQREIGSFAQAIMILGRQQLRRWLHLMLFSARDEDPRSAMLTARVMLRARTMELAAEALGQDRAAQEQAFMAGLFSLLGVLFGQPLAEVLRTLALPDALVAALLRGEGELGALLARVEAAEAPPTHTASAPPGADCSGELSPLRWAQLQLAALLWATGGQEH